MHPHDLENITRKKVRISPERRVIKQVIEALLFEKICKFKFHDGYFHFCLNNRFYRVSGYLSAFSRVRVNSDYMRYSHEQFGPHFKEIELRLLIADLPTAEEVKERLTEQLAQTIRLCNWNEMDLPCYDSRRSLHYSQLESAIDEGHPYHPCFKARTGFSIEDHKLYGPEYGNQFQLHWLAVKSCYIKAQHNCLSSDIFWQKELGAETYQHLKNILSSLTDDNGEYALLPIHPWQWQSLQDRLHLATVNEQILYLGAMGDHYQASISVRTLFNVTNPEKANIKLPLNMVNTSSLRILESYSICTAPVISNWLRVLLDSDPYLSSRLTILEEYAGFRPCSNSSTSPAWINELDGQLGVIFRQSATQFNNEDQLLTFVALCVIERDGKPFIDPWIKTYGCKQWLKKLIDTLVLPIWHLLVHHGIALEAHAQNIILNHTNGWPESVTLRDFHDSLEFVHEYLAKPELAPKFAELEPHYKSAKDNEYYWMSDVDALRELIVDTLFVFNLSDLGVLLEQYYQFDESMFWQEVSQSFSRYRCDGITAHERIDQVAIFQPNITTESLLRKKFNGESTSCNYKEFHHQISNPITDITLPSKIRKTDTANDVNTQLSKVDFTLMFSINDDFYSQIDFDTQLEAYQSLEIINQHTQVAVCVEDNFIWLTLCYYFKSKNISAMPIHPSMPYDTAKKMAKKAGCGLLIFNDISKIEPLQDAKIINEESVTRAGIIQMSSGTTGEPKCILRSWADIDIEINSYVDAFNDATNMTPIIACPITHSYGLICGVMVAIARGQAPKIITSINPKYLIKTLLNTERPLLYSSPVMLQGLVRLLPKNNKIYAAMTSGSTMSDKTFHQILPHIGTLYQQYGCSETGCVSISQNIQRANDLGKSLPHVDIKCSNDEQDPSEILVYVKTEQGINVVHTQDLGVFYGEHLHFVERLDDTIIVSGLNVYPSEIENIILNHPDVQDAVIFKIDDAFAGHRVCLQYVSSSQVNANELRLWCSKQLAPFQVPHVLLPVEEIQRMANSKVNRKLLALNFQQSLAKETDHAVT